MVAFANIFHHRIFSLFYRAWAEARATTGFDRPGDDRFAFYVSSLCGRGMNAAADRDAMPDLAKRHFAGRLGLQTRNAEGLEAICRSFFKIPVRIEEFIGEWLVLPAHQLCRLGESRLTGRLGVNTTVGGRVWSCQHKFRLVFGPMKLEDYRRFLPGSGSLERLIAIVRNYMGDELAWDVNLVLLGDEKPRLKLGQQGRLGWTTWLPASDGRNDRRDLYLDPLPEIE
jgi:type VI secretion system protein ImpH